MYTYLSIYLSISLSLYIYIYIHTHLQDFRIFACMNPPRLPMSSALSLAAEGGEAEEKELPYYRRKSLTIEGDPSL